MASRLWQGTGFPTKQHNQSPIRNTCLSSKYRFSANMCKPKTQEKKHIARAAKTMNIPKVRLGQAARDLRGRGVDWAHWSCDFHRNCVQTTTLSWRAQARAACLMLVPHTLQVARSFVHSLVSGPMQRNFSGCCFAVMPFVALPRTTRCCFSKDCICIFYIFWQVAVMLLYTLCHGRMW